MSAGRTVKVSNVSLGATAQDIKEFFTFSGDIYHVELQSGDQWSQIAYVTFRLPEGAETALLLSGATIVDRTVIIAPAPEYVPPPVSSASPATIDGGPAAADSASKKAEDVVSSMLAKGFVLGKDALGKAKTFDEKHKLTSTATTRVASFDQRFGVTEKITMGTVAVNTKVKEMDQKYQVSEKTKSALAVAEQKVNTAGSALMKNPYVAAGASWMSNAFSKVTKTASDIGAKTKEKVAVVEQQKQSQAGYVPLYDDPRPSSG